MKKPFISPRSSRRNSEIRQNDFRFDLGHHADGYCLARFGNTQVLCTARIDNRVPPHIRGSGSGWLTAEYAMLPNATGQRISRMKSLEGGRTKEIARLIGRSLRAACNFSALGERQILIDCDVLHADGGTRTTAINGAFIALYRALEGIKHHKTVLHSSVAAISCALIGNQVRVDPDYLEDSAADADANFVFSGKGGLIEAQMTAESEPISPAKMLECMNVAQQSCAEITRLQASVLGGEHNHFLFSEE